MTKVKICGITNPEDAQMAIDLGADFLGFVNAEKSTRYLTPDEISRIISEVEPLIPTVLVTHSQSLDEITNSFEAAGTDILQIHAPLDITDYESIKEIVPTVIGNISIPAGLDTITSELKLRTKAVSEIVDYTLFDTKFGKEIGGTGRTYDWGIAKELEAYSNKPVIIAGGLNPSNVAEAVKKVSPFAVDVSSGVESEPGKKDPRMVREFIRRAKPGL
jgi:phosphoribosylanthranilate isomerase